MSENVSERGKQTALTKAAFRPVDFPIQFPPTWLAGQAEGEFLTTVDTETYGGKCLVMAALNSETQSIDTVLNTTIEVSGFTMHPASKVVEETGEITRLIRCILHCKDGNNYACFSDGALKSLRLYCSMFKDKAFATPIKCKPVRFPTSGGRSMYRLEWQLPKE